MKSSIVEESGETQTQSVDDGQSQGVDSFTMDVKARSGTPARTSIRGSYCGGASIVVLEDRVFLNERLGQGRSSIISRGQLQSSTEFDVTILPFVDLRVR